MKKIALAALMILAGMYTWQFVTGSPARADGIRDCLPDKAYAFRYAGTVYDDRGNVIDLSQVGTFEFTRTVTGGLEMSGGGTLRLYFVSGPDQGTDLTIQETFVSDRIITTGCGGTIEFTATWSDGSVHARSVSFEAAMRQRMVEFQSTSPGTIASGSGVRQ